MRFTGPFLACLVLGLTAVHAEDFQPSKQLPNKGALVLKLGDIKGEAKIAPSELAAIRFGDVASAAGKKRLGPIEIVFLKGVPDPLRKAKSKHEDLDLVLKSGTKTYTIKLTGVTATAGPGLPDRSTTFSILEPSIATQLKGKNTSNDVLSVVKSQGGLKKGDKGTVAGLVEPVISRRQVIGYRSIAISVVEGKTKRVLFEAAKP